MMKMIDEDRNIKILDDGETIIIDSRFKRNIDFLKLYPALKSLTIRCHVSDLSILKKCPNLESLKLEEYITIPLDELTKCLNLKEFWFYHEPTTLTEIVEYIEPLQRCEKLEYIRWNTN